MKIINQIFKNRPKTNRKVITALSFCLRKLYLFIYRFCFKKYDEVKDASFPVLKRKFSERWCVHKTIDHIEVENKTKCPHFDIYIVEEEQNFM